MERRRPAGWLGAVSAPAPRTLVYTAGMSTRAAQAFFVAIAMGGLIVSCCGPCLAPCIPGVWPRTAPAQERGAFLLQDDYIVDFYRQGPHHRIELRRAAETLDAVEVPASQTSFVCMGAASRDNDLVEYVAIAEEDSAHEHPVRFAWKVDKATKKLVRTDSARVHCNVDTDE
jgi:hypothetical protein